jgi:hypothetical protein
MLSDYLVEIVESRANQLKDEWINRAHSNDSVPDLEQMKGTEFTEHIGKMYGQLGKYMEKTHETEELVQFFITYGDFCKKQGISSYEILSMITLSRHTLWEYIMERETVSSALDWQQLTEFWQRVMKFFDEYAYFVMVGYEEGTEISEESENTVSKFLSSLSLGSLPEVSEESV